MKRNASIQQVLESMDHSVVIRRLEINILSYVLILSGIILLIFAAQQAHNHKDLVESFLLLAGICILLWGFLSGINEKYHFKHKLSGNKILFHEMYFDKNDFHSINEMIENANFNGLSSYSGSTERNFKLVIAYTPDLSFCMVQGVKFIPFDFSVLTITKQLNVEQASELFKQLLPDKAYNDNTYLI